ncbi:MAG: hypothetical protein IT176_04530 [Acidobacteria bacterium]|nr:hypothetical protein [Acidobacteriota bacterium]
MRVLVLAVVILMAPPAAFARQTSGNPADQSPPAPSPQDTLILPVSIEKIQKALAQEPIPPLRGLDVVPTFRVSIEERQKFTFNDIIAAMEFQGGPPVPGGVYAYEQNRLNFAPDNPVRDPYAAFSQSELLTIVIENLAVRYLGGKALNAVTAEVREAAEQAARHEVQTSIAAYCAAKPNGGAGIRLCDVTPR